MKKQAGGKDTNLKAPDKNFLAAFGIIKTKFNIQKLCKAKWKMKKQIYDKSDEQLKKITKLAYKIGRNE